MAEEDKRAYLDSMHSPVLDALRAAVRTETTSILIRIVGDPRRLDLTFRAEEPRARDDYAGWELHTDKLRAAILACCDEIDRRMPVPT
jgi:hypothetical protein